MEMTQSLRDVEFDPADIWTQHATRAVFFIGGFGAASWAPLVPLLRQRLAIGEDILGLLLLFGAIMGCIDVVANVQAVIVEKAAGKRLMSGMYGLWSVGGFAGAGLFGVWVGGLGLTPTVSTLIAAGIMVAAILFFARFLLPYGGDAGGKMLAIPKGIVAFVGIIACIAFLVEGAIMDWSGVFLTTVRGFDMSLAGTGFTVFSAAMLTMRLVGDRLVQKMGQKVVILGGSVLAFAGFLDVIFASQAWLLYAGFFAIGVGSANIVPVFFSLLGKQQDMPIGLAVPAVSTLGYLGILMGPAAIGALAHATSLYAAFGLLAGLVALQFIIARYVYQKIL